ncbi:SPASM domain-containing protein, partial [bacterium]|nr:SPASM domain-containing protein [bacterium]
DRKDYFKKAREVASEIGLELNYPELSLKSYTKCLFETICLISCEGEVIPCSACAYKRPFYIKEKGYMHKRVSFGNINEKSFMDIWNSPEFLDFRRRKKFGLLPDFCDHCLISHGVIVPKGGRANEV